MSEESKRLPRRSRDLSESELEGINQAEETAETKALRWEGFGPL